MADLFAFLTQLMTQHAAIFENMGLRMFPVFRDHHDQSGSASKARWPPPQAKWDRLFTSSASPAFC
jgi:hypothetical protein